ncbi:MAG: aldose 1-epimerase [Betaproteobacteria bacterium AqS2]|uniref:Aldose 1-epimerase n=1 Tax=Candidatus Amphirhobacter heronislandensis TaxID=1732024 RepID=A0A930UFJ4_9GAMM|nr:aldose 1-epimerase [Betaproteobacteria bacterium AqS2]
MHQTILLENERLRLAAVPGMGGGLASFDARLGGAWRPLMRPADLGPATVPFDLACILMLPWCNRIFGGGFSHAGQRHELAPTLPDQPLPLHGNGFTQAWTPRQESGQRLELELQSDAIAAFHYHAVATYSLDGDALEMALAVRHLGAAPMPYGLGFHPWFVREPDATLLAPATHFGLADEELRPQGWREAGAEPDRDYRRAAPLPQRFTDTAFSGWDGAAEISWPSYGCALALRAAGAVAANYHLFAPAPDCGFFCFEPVSHLIDEHNQAAPARPPGLAVLGRGEELRGSLRLQLREI